MPRSIVAALMLFLVGAVAGAAGDLGHVLTGTTVYPPDIYGLYWLGQPWWAPPLFGFTGVAAGLTQVALDPVLGRRRRIGARSASLAALGVVAFLVLYLASGLLSWDSRALGHLVVASGAVVIWLAFDCTWQGVVYGAIFAACGTAMEMFLVSHGVFQYGPSASNWNGVAIWLPWLYAAGSVIVGNVARVLIEGPSGVSDHSLVASASIKESHARGSRPDP